MSELKQSIGFCKTRDDVRIAYAVMGKGPPLVWGPHFLCHLEFDLKSPLWLPWLAELTRHNTLTRYGREREIVELLAHGLDNSQIAARLGLSEKTVRNNITPILDKLAVESRPQAIVRAREAGFAAAPLPKAN